METALTLNELVELVDTKREKEFKQFKQQALLQGAKFDDDEEEDPITRIKRKLMGDDPETNDIANLIKAPRLQQELGFDAGFGYKTIDG